MSFRSELFFKHIYGSTRSPTSFVGPLWRLCAKDNHNLPQIEFITIVSPLDSKYSSIKQTDDLSYAQILLEYAVGISRWKVKPRYTAWKIRTLKSSKMVNISHQTNVFVDSRHLP